MDLIVVEGKNLGFWVSEEYWRVARNNKLSVPEFLQHVMNQNQKAKLPLGGKGRFWFIYQKESISLELVLEQSKKTFPMRTSMKTAAPICTEYCEIIYMGSHVEKALCTKKESGTSSFVKG